MGKADFNSPKAIANRIKAKGLQKLRWYCQMCGKQCRDENGFKCHLTSESHKRQMELFGQAPQKVIDEFTAEFESTFLQHLRQCHPFSRVSANVVYNEFIQDRNHVHMNSTKWLTLTEFVKYLGREGKCKVEDTPKGWFITLIQKDPLAEMDEKRRNKREREELDEEERHKRMLDAQAERARSAVPHDGDEQHGGGRDPEAAEFRPEDLKGSIQISLGGDGSARGGALAVRHVPRAVPFEDVEGEEQKLGTSGHALSRLGATGSSKKSKLEEMMEKEMQAKQRTAIPAAELAPGQTSKGSSSVKQGLSHSWLAKDIVVKVMSKALKEHGYYKQKGVVIRIVDKRVGEIEMVGSSDIIRVDQAELETVVPQPGGAVLVLVGPMRGCKGTLVSIDEAAYKGNVLIVDSRSGEKTTVALEYEDFSKLASTSES